ncbi:MAG: tRNA (adenosine(37)-N6)-dimethylallyltransferase MiaA [Bacteroidota bacterium]
MKKLLSIVGPTAVGKTRLSLLLAEHFGTDIISTDARQFYIGMDIGTAKPSQEERRGISHHFVDCLQPDQNITAAEYAKQAEALIEQQHQFHDFLITVGGSTLYNDVLWNGLNDIPPTDPSVRAALEKQWKTEGLEAMVDQLAQYDPITYQKIDRKNPVRIIRALAVYVQTGHPISSFQLGRSTPDRPYQLIKIGLTDEREPLYQRINERVDQMLEAGLVAEVDKLMAQGFGLMYQSMQSIGYQEIIAWKNGQYDKDEAIRLIKRNSRRYAKRQLSWFKRDPEIRWFQASKWQDVLPWLRHEIKNIG